MSQAEKKRNLHFIHEWMPTQAAITNFSYFPPHGNHSQSLSQGPPTPSCHLRNHKVASLLVPKPRLEFLLSSFLPIPSPLALPSTYLLILPPLFPFFSSLPPSRRYASTSSYRSRRRRRKYLGTGSFSDAHLPAHDETTDDHLAPSAAIINPFLTFSPPLKVYWSA